MDWGAIGAIGEIVGALAVVVSLLYLATQIRIQNRESQIASTHEILGAFRDIAGTYEDSEKAELLLRASADFESLSDVERIQFIAMAQKILRVWEEAFHQHRTKRLETHVWNAICIQFSDFMGTPGAQRAWELRKHGFSHDFCDFMQTIEPGELSLG